MRTLETLLTKLDTLALGWWAWIVPHAADVLILAAVVWLVDALARKRSAVWRAALWTIVLLKMLLPVRIDSPVSVVGWLQSEVEQAFPAIQPPPTESLQNGADPIASARSLTVDAQREEKPVLTQPAPQPIAGRPEISQPVAPVSADPEAGPVAPLSAPVEEEPLVAATLQYVIHPPLWLFLPWLGVVSALLTICGLRTWRLRALIERTKPCPNAALRKAYEEIAGRLRLRRVPELVVGEGIGAPLVYGVWRPKVVLPVTVAESMPLHELRPVLAHELGHVRRMDPLVNWLQVFCRLFFFWHPGFWLADFRIRKYREEACDDVALAVMDGERRTYAQGILHVLELGYASPVSVLTLLGSSEERRGLESRLKRILQLRRLATRLSLVGLLAVLAIAAVVLPGVKEPAEAAEVKLEQHLTGVFQAEAMPLNEVLDALAERTDVEYRFEGDASGYAPTFRLVDSTLLDFLESVLPANDLYYEMRDGVCTIVPVGDFFKLYRDIRLKAATTYVADWDAVREGKIKTYGGKLKDALGETDPSSTVKRWARYRFYIGPEHRQRDVGAYALEDFTIRDRLEAVVKPLGLEYFIQDNFCVIERAERLALLKSAMERIDSVARGTADAPSVRGILEKPVPEPETAVSLSEFPGIMARLSEASGLSFVLEKGDYPRFTFSAGGLSVVGFLETVLTTYRLDYEIRNSICTIFPNERMSRRAFGRGLGLEALREKIPSDVVTPGTKLSAVLQAIQRESNFSFMLDPGADRPVRFGSENPTVGDLFERLLPGNGIRCESLKNDVIRALPWSDGWAEYRIRDRAPGMSDYGIPGDVTASGTQLSVVLGSLEERFDLTFALDPGVDQPVTFSLQNPTLFEVLDAALPRIGLHYVALKDGPVRICSKNVISSAGPLRVERQTKVRESLDKTIPGDIVASGTQLSIILQILREDTGISFVLDEGVGRPVTFAFKDPTIEELLDAVLPSVGLDYVFLEGGAIRVGEESVIAPLKPAEAETPTAVPVETSTAALALLRTVIPGDVVTSGTQLSIILQIIQEDAGASFVLDAGADKPVTFALKNPTVAEILETVLPSVELDYVLLEGGAIRVGTEDDLRALKPVRAETPIAVPVETSTAALALLRKVIPGDVVASGTNLSIIMRIIQEDAGISFVLDAGADRPVTFALKNPTIRNLLDAVLPSVELDYLVLKSGAIRVGHESVIRSLVPAGAHIPVAVPDETLAAGPVETPTAGPVRETPTAIPTRTVVPPRGFEALGLNKDSGLEEYRVSIPGLPSDAKPLEMVSIPAGTFMMGSPEDEYQRSSHDWPRHRVTLTRPFYLGKYELTRAQWEAIMGKKAYSLRRDPETPSDNPVVWVEWVKCAEFCNRLSEAMGYTSAYDEKSWLLKPEADGFRIPTEAEWEYACRAGTQTAYSFGDHPPYEITTAKPDSMERLAEWMRNEMVKPNPWGLLAMHRGVFEYCSDRWEASHDRGPQVDPPGPGKSVMGSVCVLRSATDQHGGRRDRSAARYGHGMGDGRGDIGFRLAMTRGAGEGPSGEINVNITPEGTLIVDDRELSIDELAHRMRRIAESTPGVSVIVRSDAKVHFERLREVITVCSEAGLTNISVAVSSAESKEGGAERSGPKRTSRLEKRLDLDAIEVIVETETEPDVAMLERLKRVAAEERTGDAIPMFDSMKTMYITPWDQLLNDPRTVYYSLWDQLKQDFFEEEIAHYREGKVRPASVTVQSASGEVWTGLLGVRVYTKRAEFAKKDRSMKSASYEVLDATWALLGNPLKTTSRPERCRARVAACGGRSRAPLLIEFSPLTNPKSTRATCGFCI